MLNPLQNVIFLANYRIVINDKITMFLIVLVALRFKSISTVLIVGILLGYVAFSVIEILVQGGSEMEISQCFRV